MLVTRLESGRPAKKSEELARGKPFLTFYDKERGFVLKKDILKHLKLHGEADVNLTSNIIEVLEDGEKKIEVIRLPVY
jgi:hypothetical protein